jgi:hypothetical protein
MLAAGPADPCDDLTPGCTAPFDHRPCWEEVRMPYTLVAEGLAFPEGPVVMPDWQDTTILADEG